MRSDERYGPLASQHTEEPEKSDRGRCWRPYFNKPIYDSDSRTQDKGLEIRSHRTLLARAHPPIDRPPQSIDDSDDSVDLPLKEGQVTICQIGTHATRTQFP